MSSQVAQITTDGDFRITGNLNTRLPNVTDGLVAHYPFDGTDKKYYPITVRYIRDKIEGSTANTGNHWIEFQAIDYNGNNLALGKTLSNVRDNPLVVTDGIINSTYAHGGLSFDVESTNPYVTLDLGNSYSIKEIKIWHYYPDGRTYYKSKTEVSEDGVNWFIIFDSEIEGEYAETAAGKTHDLTNLGVTCKPIVNTNTTITYDGIAVEEATTNLMSSPEFNLSSLGGNWGSWDSSVLTFSQVYIFGKKTTAVNLTKKADGASNAIHQSRSGLTVSSDYTVSFYARIYPSSVQTNGTIKAYINSYSSHPISKKWTRIILTQPASATSNTVHITQYSNSYDVQIVMVQFEKKSFPTSFINGSRGSGLLKVDFSYKPPYTINIFHKSSKIMSSVVDQGSSPMIFHLGEGYYTNASISFWNYIGQLAVYIKGDTGSSWCSSPKYISFDSNNWDNKENMYTLIAIDSRTFKVYMNGIYLGQSTSSIDITNINNNLLCFGNTSMPDAIYRDLSIYNKALTDIEIKTLTSSNFHLQPNGDLITSSIKNRPLIPSDATYFPLDCDAKDEFKVIEPITEETIVYEDGSVWVGNATTNEYSYPTFETVTSTGGWNHWGSTGHIGSYGQNIDRIYIYGHQSYSHWVKNDIGATGNYLVYQSPACGDTDRSLQCIVCMDDFSEVTESKLYPAWNAPSGGTPNNHWTSIEKIGDSYFYLCKAEGIHQDGTNDLVGIYVRANCKAYFSQVQLEQTSFCTPFVNGTRGVTKLYYPYNIIDCKQDFTIFGWWYPKTYADGSYRPCLTRNRTSSNSTYNRILIMGNGTTSNQLRCWHGSDGVAESNVYAPSSVPIIVDEWNFFVFRRSGADISLGIGNSGGFGIGTTATAYSLDNDEDSATWGWLVGRYSSDSGMANAYFKDYAFAQASLTDIEIENIYKEKMNISTGTLTLQNGIQTGVTLLNG